MRIFSLSMRGLVFNDIDGSIPPASCTASLERTFSKRYLSVHSNLANLNLDTAVMQLERRPRG